MKTPQTLEEFMAQALAMERDAAQRYHEMADAMETHNNREVAQLFRTMAGYEAKHAETILAEMNWVETPGVPPGAWPTMESPEMIPSDAVHYLMHPWHALELALAAEQRAEAFFAELVRATTNDSVRSAAIVLREEEAEHVALVKQWMAKFPKPEVDWAVDPDPPRYND
jgi:rubrerythrin